MSYDWDWKNYLQRGLGSEAKQYLKVTPVSGVFFQDQLHGKESPNWAYKDGKLTAQCVCGKTQTAKVNKCVLCLGYRCERCEPENTPEGEFEVQIMNACGSFTGILRFPLADCPDVVANLQRVAAQQAPQVFTTSDVILYWPTYAISIHINRLIDQPRGFRKAVIGVFAPDGVDNLTREEIEDWETLQETIAQVAQERGTQLVR